MIPMAETLANDQILNSWKEIARYLHRGVRTVQRWEAELGLPVRRPRGRSRSAVIAMRSELDDWLRVCPLATNHEAKLGPFLVKEPVNRTHSNQKLHRSEETAVAAQLCAQLAHDINNPLQAVRNALILLERQSTLGGEGRQLIGIATRATRRLGKITNDICSFSGPSKELKRQDASRNAKLEGETRFERQAAA